MKTHYFFIILFFCFSCRSSVEMSQTSEKKNVSDQPVYSACTSNGQVKCLVQNEFLASAPVSQDYTGPTASLHFPLPTGYYNGVHQVTAFDPSLTAPHILTGKTIFGVSGTMVPASAFSSCTTNGQVGCLTTSTFSATPPASSSVSSNPSSLVISVPAGYYNGTTTSITASSSALVPTHIQQGKTIFGVTGTAYLSDYSLGSTAFRTSGTTQMTTAQETSTYAGNTFPTGYRDVPDQTVDFEWNNTSRISWTTHMNFQNCGLTPSTIALKIADCALSTKNGSNATWDGRVLGVSGEGVWKLVTRNTPEGTCTGTTNSCQVKEVWQDASTGLLWSSLVAGGITGTSTATLANWCQASGNTQNAGGANCSTNTKSFCAEVLTPGIASETWVANTPGTYTYDLTKGGLGRYSTPGVRWRLPTASDYLLAMVHGFSYVLIDSLFLVNSLSYVFELAATSNGVSSFSFYNVIPATGALRGSSGASASRVPTNYYRARCVGR